MFKVFDIFKKSLVGFFLTYGILGHTQEFFPAWKVPNLGHAAESYFSPDDKTLIFNAKLEGDKAYYVYTANVDGTNVRRINDKGEDACTFFFPDGKSIIWTSTRDNKEMGGSYEDPLNYPQGAEIYRSDLRGDNKVRLTNNLFYDAEVSVSPNGQWILFTRQINGVLDLWRMRPDGSEEAKVIDTPEWQETGAYFLPDSETIVVSAWPRELEKKGRPMSLFSMKVDGSEYRRLANDEDSRWRPFPTPDGKHILFNKVVAPQNYEIYLMDLDTRKETRLTFEDGFDGYPSVSSDGRTMSYSSMRGNAPNDHGLYIHLMDISKLNLGRKWRRR